MNAMHQMKDPAAGVPPQLLPHVHLVSKHRYPLTNNPSLEMIVGFLLEAPKIMHEAQPVQWQMLDCPADGTMLLTWQPPDLGTNFASDGYVFNDHEQMFNSDVRGYSLQMYMYRSGFRPGVDLVAAHSRRRYRLLPSQQNMGGAMPDPSLWLIHYSKGAQRDHIPAASIPVMPQIHAQLQQRRMIQNQGALARKEFMLRDRNNWPTINLPGGLGRQAVAGPAAQVAHRRGPSVGMAELTVDEEEDVSRGDALDFMTPRDVSRMRYEQHHEWMEEILESPYATLHIIPPELGLGRKGELESLTKDFFGAPTTVQEVSTDGHPARVGKLEPGKAEEFTKLAEQRLADMQAELEKMKQAHQIRMEKLRKSSHLNTAEKRLRTASNDGGRHKSLSNGVGASPADIADPLDEIVRDVETSTGKKVERVKTVTCVDKGGYQEQSVNLQANPERAQSSMSPAKPNNLGMATPQPGVPQQQEQQSRAPQSNVQVHGNDMAMANKDSASPKLKQPALENPSTDIKTQDEHGSDVKGDIEMAGLDDEPHQDAQGGDANDWVMVGDHDLPNTGATPGLESKSSSGNQGQTPGDMGLMPDTGTSGFDLNTTDQQSAPMQQQMHQADDEPSLDTGDFDMGTDFDNVNTAGDELEAFHADDLNLDNMDDSAFGDAFHPPEDDELS